MIVFNSFPFLLLIIVKEKWQSYFYIIIKRTKEIACLFYKLEKVEEDLIEIKLTINSNIEFNVKIG